MRTEENEGIIASGIHDEKNESAGAIWCGHRWGFRR